MNDDRCRASGPRGSNDLGPSVDQAGGPRVRKNEFHLQTLFRPKRSICEISRHSSREAVLLDTGALPYGAMLHYVVVA